MISSPMVSSQNRSGDSGRGWAQKISFFRVRRFTESPKPLHWIAWTPFSEKGASLHWFCFVASPPPNSIPTKSSEFFEKEKSKEMKKKTLTAVIVSRQFWGFKNTIFKGIFVGASKIVLTKARLLKHDFPRSRKESKEKKIREVVESPENWRLF